MPYAFCLSSHISTRGRANIPFLALLNRLQHLPVIGVVGRLKQNFAGSPRLRSNTSSAGLLCQVRR